MALPNIGINWLETLGTIRTLVSSMDVDGSGTITLDEFREKLLQPRVAWNFYNLGLDIANAELFFKILCAMAQEHKVDIEAFVEGCARMKG